MQKKIDLVFIALHEQNFHLRCCLSICIIFWRRVSLSLKQCLLIINFSIITVLIYERVNQASGLSHVWWKNVYQLKVEFAIPAIFWNQVDELSNNLILTFISIFIQPSIMCATNAERLIFSSTIRKFIIRVSKNLTSDFLAHQKINI